MAQTVIYVHVDAFEPIYWTIMEVTLLIRVKSNGEGDDCVKVLLPILFSHDST